MAARTGAGVGMIVTVSLTAMAAVAFFVTTLVFYGGKETAQRALLQERESTKAIATETQRNSPFITTMMETARGKQQSLAGYLQANLGELGKRIGVGDTLNIEKALQQIDAARGPSPSLLAAVADRDAEIARYKNEVTQAQQAVARLQQDLQATQGRVAQLEQGHNESLTRNREEVGAYKSQIDTYRADLEKQAADTRAALERERQQAADERARRDNEIAEVRQQLLVAQNKISELTRSRQGNLVSGAAEYALVDGEVVGLDAAGDNNVFLNRGRNDKVVLGMTFEVYGDATQIKPAATGEYPRGKASVEVIRVDDRTSTARVVRSTRGSPVARGDVIANAVYDPTKTYRFLVYGNFDPRQTGRATPEGQAEIRALVEEWGGQLVDSLSGSVDFMVLGERPVVPPAPPVEAPISVTQEYIRLRRLAQEYDRLLEQAAATSIPVLNQNRLYTLIGK